MYKWLSSLGVRFPVEAIFVAVLYYNIYNSAHYFTDTTQLIFSLLYPLAIATVGIYAAIQAIQDPPRRHSVITIVLFLIFVGFYAATSVWSISSVYMGWKVIRLITVISLVFIAGVFLFNSNPSRARFFYGFLTLAATILSAEVFLSHFVLDRASHGQLDVNYIMISRLLGAGTLSAIYFSIRYQEYYRLLYSSAAVAMFIAMLQTGARGPIIALIAGLAVLVVWIAITDSRISYRQVITSGALMLIVAGGALWLFQGTSRTLARFAQLASIDGLAAAGGRADLFATGIYYWLQAPFFGHGIGSFGLLYSGQDIRYYPHNIILEIGVEAGIIGVALFVGAVCYAVWAILRSDARDVVLQGLTLAFFTFMLTNAMVTGDISTNRTLFVALALLLTFDQSPTYEHSAIRLPLKSFSDVCPRS